jgi:GAF domain-containing protein/anti-sigma regulatory factor (Ser/Thr protein kinase)
VAGPAAGAGVGGSREARTLASLQRITDAALSYLPEQELLEALLDRVQELLTVDTVAILLVDGDTLLARAAKGIEEEVKQGVRIPIGRGFAGRIAAERSPVFIPDVDHADILNPILRERGIRSLLGVPLVVEGVVIGVLHVGSLTPRTFTHDDRDLLQAAADRAALGIERARLYEQWRVAEVLQRRILPRELPTLAGMEVGARYLPAAGGRLGGDWYDVFPLAGSKVAVAVGDVVGHGLESAAGMAQLRTALRAYAAEGRAPAEALERVNYFMWHVGPLMMTTVAFLVLDLAEETMTVANAGHPPPLVKDPSGTARFLDAPSGVALGATSSASYVAADEPFPTGSTVLLYTDGLVERRGEPLDAGLERLRRLAEHVSGAEALCAMLADRLVPAAPSDDVAFIAVRVAPLADRLRRSWPASTESLSEVRQLLRRWLRARGAGDDEIFDITVACQEACTNAIEHAYAPGPAGFQLDGTIDGAVVELAIRDRGRWRPPRGEHRGRGMPLMRRLMDSVDIRDTGDGTEVRLRRRLGAAR